MLLCDRPLARNVDYANAQFVVGKVSGLDVNGQHLEMGDLVPSGALNAYALQCEYDAPLRRIEVVDFAVKDPELVAVCKGRGVDLEAIVSRAAASPEAPPAPIVFCPDLNTLDTEDLVDLCEQNKLSCAGNAKQLRARLRKHLEG